MREVLEFLRDWVWTPSVVFHDELRTTASVAASAYEQTLWADLVKNISTRVLTGLEQGLPAVYRDFKETDFVYVTLDLHNLPPIGFPYVLGLKIKQSM